MKSNRRKQTNPNRVSAGGQPLDPLLLPQLTDKPPCSEQEDDELNLAAEDMVEDRCRSPSPLSQGSCSDMELPLDMHVPFIKCFQCSQRFPSQKDLQEHVTAVHDREPESKRPRLEMNGEEFPTAYHRRGRELIETTDTSASGDRAEPNLRSDIPVRQVTPPLNTDHFLSPEFAAERLDEGSPYSEPAQVPTSLSSQPPVRASKESLGEMPNGKSDRIFHMDAYCELCDREFCNKYFLKTHKANKHGIYEDSSPPASNVPMPFPGLMLPQDPLASFNFKMDTFKPPVSEPMLPWSFKLESPPQPQPPQKKPENSAGVTRMDTPLSLFPMPPLPMESPKSMNNKNIHNGGSSSLPSSSTGISSSSFATSANSVNLFSSITNSIKGGTSTTTTPSNPDSGMEDYCHICQKHFCNKYYLRKHKQDVHGIVPDNPPANSNKRSRSSFLDLPLSSASSMMLPQPLVSLAGMHNLPGMHGLPSLPNMANVPPGMMVINPYALPPVALIPPGSLMPGQQLPPPPHPMLTNPMGLPPLPDQSHLSHLPPSSMSNNPYSSNHSPKSNLNNQDGSGGVHCNICSKEFCNDFYLQIHKESKHGIRRNTGESPRDKALPLVKEKNRDAVSPASVPRSESLRPPSMSPRDLTTNSDGHLLICNFCNKEFSNRYLYRIHRIHEHGIHDMMDQSLMENGELSHREHILNSLNESLMRLPPDPASLNFPHNFGPLPPNCKPPSEGPVVCDLCNQQISNQYFLRMHKFNVHGVDSNNDKYDRKPTASPGLHPVSKSRTSSASGPLSVHSPHQQPLNLTHLPGKPPLLPFLPPKIDFKDIPSFVDFSREFKGFRDLPPFLSDPLGSEFFARSQNTAMHMDLNFFGLSSLGKIPLDDNIKLNFDPEAYCEICKKEFCSKYFLRTHRQNIHGIKSDNNTTSSAIAPKTAPEPEKPISSSPPEKVNSNINNGTNSRESMDKSPWRWKEPVNSSRVICDICNKEVCNKYFLRTHKQKKHGKHPSSQSPNMSTSGSPVGFDYDTASNTSSQPDDNNKSLKSDSIGFPQMVPLPPTDKLSERSPMKPLSFENSHSSISLNNNSEQGETCNICNRNFKNLMWLKDHIMKDHANSEALDMSAKKTSALFTCQVCSSDFPSELSVQLHLIQEHNAKVTLDTEDSQIPTEEANLPNGEGHCTRVAELCGRWTLRKKMTNHQRLKKYVCNRCGFDSHWLSSLLDHERNEHGFISDEAPVFACKICQHFAPSPRSLSGHLIAVHGLPLEEALREVKKTEPTLPNTFKCAHCPAVFPTRSWGMAHVRHVHIRSRRDLAIRNPFTKTLLRCPSCAFRTHFAYRLQQHVKSRHANSLRSAYQQRSTKSIPSSMSSSSSSSSSSSLNLTTSSALFHTSREIPNLAPTPTSLASREDVPNLLHSSMVYKSIAASLLSSSDAHRANNSPSKCVDVPDPLLLQSYRLPQLCSPGLVDPGSFKLTMQAVPPASTVVGL